MRFARNLLHCRRLPPQYVSIHQYDYNVGLSIAISQMPIGLIKGHVDSKKVNDKFPEYFYALHKCK